MDHGDRFTWKLGEWGPIDEQLCGVVDQLRSTGCNRTLEVELRLTKIGSDIGRYGFAKFLPEFRKKGVVTIIDAVHGDRVVHSSTRRPRFHGVGEQETTSF